MKRLLKGSWILRSRIWNSHCLPDCDQPNPCTTPPPVCILPKEQNTLIVGRCIASNQREKMAMWYIYVISRLSHKGALVGSVWRIFIFPSELILSGGCHKLNRLTKSRCHFSLLKAPVGCSSLQLPAPAYYCCCGINISFEKNHRWLVRAFFLSVMVEQAFPLLLKSEVCFTADMLYMTRKLLFLTSCFNLLLISNLLKTRT